MPKCPNPDYQSSYAEPATPLQAHTPLEIMLKVMRRKFHHDDLDGAVAIARAAAPYVHPRVPAAAPAPDFASLSDAELDALSRQD